MLQEDTNSANFVISLQKIPLECLLLYKAVDHGAYSLKMLTSRNKRTSVRF